MKERNRDTWIVFFSFLSLSVFQLDHLWLIAGTDSRMNSRSSVTDQPFFSSSTHPLRQGTNIWHAIKLGALLLLAQFEEAEIIRNWLHFRPPTRLLDPLFSWTEHQTDFKWELSVSVLQRKIYHVLMKTVSERQIFIILLRLHEMVLVLFSRLPQVPVWPNYFQSVSTEGGKMLSCLSSHRNKPVV